MGGRRRLRAGAPRLLGRHDGPRGRTYRRCFDALAVEFALDRPLMILEAGRVALAWTNLIAATASLEAARRERERGKGRRPNGREIRALEKRVGLADGTYSSALTQLRALAGGRKPLTIAEELSQRRAELAEIDEADDDEHGRP